VVDKNLIFELNTNAVDDRVTIAVLDPTSKAAPPPMNTSAEGRGFESPLVCSFMGANVSTGSEKTSEIAGKIRPQISSKT